MPAYCPEPATPAAAILDAMAAGAPRWLDELPLRVPDDRPAGRRWDATDSLLDTLADHLFLPGRLVSARGERWRPGQHVQVSERHPSFVVAAQEPGMTLLQQASGTLIVSPPAGCIGLLPAGISVEVAAPVDVAVASIQLYGPRDVVWEALRDRLKDHPLWRARGAGCAAFDALVERTLAAISGAELTARSEIAACHGRPFGRHAHRPFPPRSAFRPLTAMSVRGPHAGGVWLLTRRGALRLPEAALGFAELAASGAPFALLDAINRWDGAPRDAYHPLQHALQVLTFYGAIAPGEEVA